MAVTQCGFIIIPHRQQQVGGETLPKEPKKKTEMEMEVTEGEPPVSKAMHEEIEKALKGMNERVIRKAENRYNRNMKAKLRISELALRIGRYETSKERRSIPGTSGLWEDIDVTYNTLYLTTSKGILFQKVFHLKDSLEDQSVGSFDYVMLECLATVMRHGLSKLMAKIDQRFPEDLI